jgi:hypothetical protein
MNRPPVFPSRLSLSLLGLPLLGLLLLAAAGCSIFDDDDSPSGIVILFTSPDSNLVVREPEVRVEGTVRGSPTPIETVVYDVNGGQAFPIDGDQEGNFAFTARGLVEGFNTITVTATDRNGGIGGNQVRVYHDSHMQPSDFFLTLFPPTTTLERTGHFEGVTIDVWRTAALTDPMNFTAQDLPDGVSATFRGDGEYQLRYHLDLVASTSLTPGVYPVTVQGVSGGVEREATLTLGVALAAPIVEIRAPASGTTVTSPSVELEVLPVWTSGVDLDYRLNEGAWQRVFENVNPNQLYRFTADGLQEGMNTIEVRASDLLNEEVSGSASVSVTYTPGGGGGNYDLSVDFLGVAPETVPVGGMVIFSITIKKGPGDDPDPGIVVEMPVPEGLTFLSAEPPDHLGTYDPDTGRWSFTMTTIYAQLQLFARAEAAGTYPFRVEIVEGFGSPEHEDPSNNSAEVTLTVTP